MFSQSGGMALKEYISEIQKMISKLNDKDEKIIKSVYTILLRYLEKRGRS